MILVDTSAWVEFDRASGSPVHHRLRDLIASNAAIAVTEPVIMELLAGARDQRAQADLRRLLLRFDLLRVDTVADFEGAAYIYRGCRAAGVTPRGLVDCLIAAVAVRHRATLLCNDVDFVRIAPTTGLALDEASLRSPG